MHLGNQSANLDDETEYPFLGPNTHIHEDNDAVTLPSLTQTISRVSHIMSCWPLGLRNKSLVEEFCLVDIVASGSVLPIPETSENTYYHGESQ